MYIILYNIFHVIWFVIESKFVYFRCTYLDLFITATSEINFFSTSSSSLASVLPTSTTKDDLMYFILIIALVAIIVICLVFCLMVSGAVFMIHQRKVYAQSKSACYTILWVHNFNLAFQQLYQPKNNTVNYFRLYSNIVQKDKDAFSCMEGNR